jgi:hypothetical protein
MKHANSTTHGVLGIFDDVGIFGTSMKRNEKTRNIHNITEGEEGLNAKAKKRVALYTRPNRRTPST